MCPAGELLMDHGKILNDNSSNAGTLHNGAGRNYYEDSTVEWSGSTMMGVTLCRVSLYLLSIVWQAGAWQLNSLHTAPGCLQANQPPRCLETSHRHPLVCRVPLRSARCSKSRPKWRGAVGPPETGFPCVVLCSLVWSGHRQCVIGVKYSERRKYLDWQQSLRCHGVTLALSWHNWLPCSLIREKIMRVILGLEAIWENHNRPIVCIDRTTSLNLKKFQIKNPINHEPLTWGYL